MTFMQQVRYELWRWFKDPHHVSFMICEPTDQSIHKEIIHDLIQCEYEPHIVLDAIFKAFEQPYALSYTIDALSPYNPTGSPKSDLIQAMQEASKHRIVPGAIIRMSVLNRYVHTFMYLGSNKGMECTLLQSDYKTESLRFGFKDSDLGLSDALRIFTCSDILGYAMMDQVKDLDPYIPPQSVTKLNLNDYKALRHVVMNNLLSDDYEKARRC